MEKPVENGGERRPIEGKPAATPERDRLGAVLRDPRTVYVYWTLDGPRSRRVEEELGPASEWVLRVLNIAAATSTEIPVEVKAGNHYVEVQPGRTYGFELAARRGEKWRTVCRTGRIEVPSAGVTEAGRPEPGPERLRPTQPDQILPGLRYETTVPFLATSPGGPPAEEEN